MGSGERVIEEFVPTWSLAPIVQALQTLRGVDLIVAVTFATEVGDVSRFESPRQLMGYLGLVPGEQSTGDTIRRGGITKGAHAALVLDRAGWHTTDKLKVPRNITLILLPSRSPELNPVENIWQYLRANWLSNRVFEDYEDIIDAACEAWNKLTALPTVITSIGMRQWAHIGQM